MVNELVLNNSPVRTSNNYLINNIKIDDFKIDKNKEFNGIQYKILDEKNISLEKSSRDVFASLEYPIGLEKTILEDNNVSLKFIFNHDSSIDNIIYFMFDKDNNHLIENIDIVVPENVNGKMTICYCNNKELEGEFTGIHAGIINTTVKNNGSLKLTVVNLLEKQIRQVLKMKNTLDENAILNYNVVEFGENNSITNYESNLVGDKASNSVNAVYFGADSKVLDMNYITTTRGKDSKVDMDIQGALKDNAKKHFKGTIDFKRGCKKTEGTENEFCVLLSDEAKSISLPMLLCDEEDVVGNHSTATGKIDNKELFYIMSRGLTEKEAKTIIIKARFNKVIEQIDNLELKEKILDKINEKIGE